MDALGAEASAPETIVPRGSRHKVILAGIVGNVLEWYDFAVYGFFAPVIAQQFFPDADPVASLIAAYGAFAAGFIARPFGGAIFGHIGDRYGRKMALTLSVLLMAIPTFLLGLLPNYADWGVASTVLLIALRMLQGLSVGGEYTTSTVFLVEQAPPGKRGFYGSWSNAGVVIGVLVGSGFGALIYGLLPDAAIQSWGWRVPFIVGLFVGIGGIFLRRHVVDAPVSEDVKRDASPVVVAFRDEFPAMLKVIGFALTDAVGFYLIFVYMTTFLIDQVKVPATDAFDINTGSMVILAALVPLAGILSDKIGRKPVMLVATGGIALLSWPLLWMMHHT